MSKHEPFTIVDKFVASLDSSNLRVDKFNNNADAIIAVAMSDIGGIGSSLWRIKYSNTLPIEEKIKCAEYLNLQSKWTLIVVKKSVKENWHVKARAKEIARISLQYWLNDVCEACKGTAKAPHPANAQVLSDDPCAICHGTAKRPLSGFKNQIEHIGNCVVMLESEEKALGSRAMQKLRKEFEL